MAIDPTLLQHFEQHFISEAGGMFGKFIHIASLLVYIVAAIELAWFGLRSALKGDGFFVNFIFTLLKIAAIIFIIQHLPTLLNGLINGFVYLGILASSKNTLHLLNNPTAIWNSSFSAAISTLKVAIQYGPLNVGASMLYLFFGIGSLIFLTLISIQIMLVIFDIYFTSLASLTFLPFSVLGATSDIFNSCIKRLLQTGLKLMVIVILLALIQGLLAHFSNVTIAKGSNFMTPLVLFMSLLTACVFVYVLPASVAKIVARPRFAQGDTEKNSITATSQVTSTQQANAYVSSNPISNETSLQSTTSNTNVSSLASATAVTQQTNNTTQSTNTTSTAPANSGSLLNPGKSGTVQSATTINIKINNQTLKTLKQLMHTKANKS